jgi:zinc transporter ZupT
MHDKEMNNFISLLRDYMIFTLTTAFLLQVLVCIVMGFYIHAPVITESSKLMQFLNPAVLGGYIIVITGLIMSLVINERVPRKVVGT